LPEPSEPRRTGAWQARKNIDASHEPRSGTPRACGCPAVWRADFKKL